MQSEMQIRELMTRHPKAIGDDHYLTSVVWATDLGLEGEAFIRRQQALFKFLCAVTPSETVMRLKRKILSDSPLLKEKVVDTRSEREVLGQGYSQKHIDGVAEQLSALDYIKQAKELLKK